MIRDDELEDLQEMARRCLWTVESCLGQDAKAVTVLRVVVPRLIAELRRVYHFAEIIEREASP